MTAWGFWRGHEVWWNESVEEWCYADTNTAVPEDPHRNCGYCGLPYGEDVDPCLGWLPGVANACCGHGESWKSYIQFDNGVRIGGFDVPNAAQVLTDKTAFSINTEYGSGDREYAVAESVCKLLEMEGKPVEDNTIVPYLNSLAQAGAEFDIEAARQLVLNLHNYGEA